MSIGLQHLSEYIATSIGVALAMLTIAVGRALFGRRWPLTIDDTETIRGHQRPKSDGPDGLNVEAQDSTGALIRGKLLKVSIRNGSGATYLAKDGVFAGCDPSVIEAGAIVRLNVQGGRFQEDVVVKFDPTREILFVKSHFSIDEILSIIHGE